MLKGWDEEQTDIERERRNEMLLVDKAKGAVMCECVNVCLTLPPATTDFPEAGSITQPVESLLFDQLHDLWLDLLPQLP